MIGYDGHASAQTKLQGQGPKPNGSSKEDVGNTFIVTYGIQRGNSVESKMYHNGAQKFVTFSHRRQAADGKSGNSEWMQRHWHVIVKVLIEI
ncbi:unnamed protein product [Fusarium venenatum]|uniref:Uncharacterized protein n=1 Tax=Fusarium venenatum TaxID=56646 RepID=A0A2L2TI77_9HYPO|nr:uncharacterized protein FVRRES_07172 [Fusarium venenatum]CEI62736.1 unnamed protein product [Fusarium venenatum]